ncbi:MAG: ImmA/IrrE family metallo-endopeptidase [Proteobacteria bacterium]|nr:ImmA/IrrE family metallo-endopeptidase [Pseudomonadota bacterium]
MRLVRDTTGRFQHRPHYEPAELDRECERILSAFFGGRIPVPIETDRLESLIERDTSDFDPGADLSAYGTDVEGVTEFMPPRKPKVRIVADLAYDEVRKNRYRTTLSHEYGHVHFHAHLFAEPLGADLFATAAPKRGEQICKRENIINARQTDWMEWQAGYVCGALLMPISAVRRVVGAYQERNKLFGPLETGSADGAGLINAVRTEFQVSADAARVRLVQLTHLQSQAQGRSLFAS